MKILVVEDDEPILSFICRGLEEEGYLVNLARDGEEGLRKALQGVYDVIVLDLQLPKLGGLDLLRSLRARGHQDAVLLLTARDAVRDKVEGLDAGADDYLTKPFSFEEFLARLRALVRRGSPSREPALRVADLTLDPVSKSVSRGGQSIDLSAREFTLLECLMRNAGKVLSRTRIYENVWEGRYDGLTNVVDVYVNYLRRKLETQNGPRLIHTLRGQGYVLRAPALGRSAE